MQKLPESVYILALKYCTKHADLLDAEVVCAQRGGIRSTIRRVEAELQFGLAKGRLAKGLPRGMTVSEVMENFAQMIQETYDHDCDPNS